MTATLIFNNVWIIKLPLAICHFVSKHRGCAKFPIVELTLFNG